MQGNIACIYLLVMEYNMLHLSLTRLNRVRKGSYRVIFYKLNENDFCNYLGMPPRIIYFI